MSLNVSRFAGASTSLLTARIIAITCTFLQVPISLHYLGVEVFGLWATLINLTTLLSFVDLGIGNGLQNRVAHCIGTTDSNAERRAIGTSFVFLLILGCLLLAILTPIAAYTPWADLFHLHDQNAKNNATGLILLFLGFFCLGLPISIAPKIALGRQMNGAYAASQAITGALTLLAVFLASKLELSLLPFFALSILPQYGANILLGVFLHLSSPGRYDFSTQEARDLLRTSRGFLPPQLGAAIMITAPSIILSSTLGAAATTPYNICQRIFSPLSIICSTILTPLWSAYSVAKAKGNGAWIRKTYLISFFGIAAIAGIYCLLISIFYQHLLTLWVGNTILISQGLIITFSIWTFVTSLGQAVATLLNGLSQLRGQCIFGTISSAVSIALMFYFGAQFGAIGIIFSQLAPYCIIAVPTVFTEAFRLAKRAPTLFGALNFSRPLSTIK